MIWKNPRCMLALVLASNLRPTRQRLSKFLEFAHNYADQARRCDLSGKCFL